MAKKKVLVVDDEVKFTNLMKSFLENTKLYEVREANNGTQGLAAAREFKPDLMFLDVMMPDIDGGAVATELGADPATKGIKIVFLTAAVTKDEVAADGGTIGGRPFLAKPVSLHEILKTLEKYLA